MNLLALESLYSVRFDVLPDAVATTTPDAAITEHLSEAATSSEGEAVTARETRRLERLVMNGFNRLTAPDYEPNAYALLAA